MPSSWVVTTATLISITSFSPTLLAISWPPSAYLWFKTLHVVGVVVWFAGLFYLVRLFIYHREAAELEPPLRWSVKPAALEAAG
jgi:hypothetical protein